MKLQCSRGSINSMSTCDDSCPLFTGQAGIVIGFGGSNSEGETTIPNSLSDNVVAVAAGVSFSLALTSDGVVTAWGLSRSGGLPDIPPSVQG